MGSQSKNDENKYDLAERTALFGEEAIRFSRSIPQDSITSPLIKQLVCSSTSVGANYSEADEAGTKITVEVRAAEVGHGTTPVNVAAGYGTRGAAVEVLEDRKRGCPRHAIGIVETVGALEQAPAPVDTSHDWGWRVVDFLPAALADVA